MNAKKRELIESALARDGLRRIVGSGLHSNARGAVVHGAIHHAVRYLQGVLRRNCR